MKSEIRRIAGMSDLLQTYWPGASPASRSQHPGQSCEIIGGHCQDERTDTLDVAIHGLSHAADGFRPAKRFFNLLSVLPGQGIDLMPDGSAIDRGIARLLGDMRCDAGLAQVGNEPSRIIALVSAQRQPSGRSGGRMRPPPTCGGHAPAGWRSIPQAGEF